MDTLRNKVAVITGAGSGIGRAIACALANRGARIVAVDVDNDRIQTLADDLSEAEVLPHHTDISNPEAFEGIRSAALQRFGRVDIVVNNVGVLTNGLPVDIPVTEWQRILDINLMSVVRSNAAFLPLLLEQGSGHLVNTASFAGLFTYSYDRLPYAATKAAIGTSTSTPGTSSMICPPGLANRNAGPCRHNCERSIRSLFTPRLVNRFSAASKSSALGTT